MTFNEFYSIVDFLLLLGIILRLIWVSIFESARTPSHTEFLFFVVIITLKLTENIPIIICQLLKKIIKNMFIKK